MKIKMADRIVLIDGHSILNRAFYGIPGLKNSEGIPTNAVYGFLNILFKILEEEDPQYLSVAFDLHTPTFRHEEYKEYKGTRHPMPEELRVQVPLIQEVLASMGVEVVTCTRYEADDILGTVAARSAADGMEVTILSGDRDLLQLASEKVLVRIPKTTKGQTVIENYHTADVIAKYQLTPSQIIDLKGLMGDASDNIPGVPGVGEKTATKILAAFGTVENAYAHIDEIMPKRAQTSMREHKEQAMLSKHLATIVTNAPIDFDMDRARLHNLYTKEAYEIFRRLDFKNLLTRFDDADKEKSPEVRVETVTTKTGLLQVKETAESAGWAGICVLADKAIRAAALSFGPEHTFSLLAGEEIAPEELGKLILDLLRSGVKVSLFDIKALLHLIGPVGKADVFDAQVAAYLMNPLKSGYTYDDIAKEYAGVTLPAAEEIFGSSKVPAADKQSRQQLAAIAGYTAYAAYCSKEPLRRALIACDMWRLYDEIELPLAFTLYDMETAGIQVNGDELHTTGNQLKVKIDELEAAIYADAGEAFNINSPKQLGVILFEKLHLPGGKKTKTGYSTAADVLERLRGDEPIVDKILEYRQLAKLKSTYTDGLQTFIEDDGRIHSTFSQTITATGRISSAEPNLQNIPVRMELGRLIRKVFVAGANCLFIDADYSQIELRVLAHLSGDENLIEAYRQNQDIHRITASRVFHVPFEEVSPLQRRNAKAVNFGIVYGISAFGLSQDLGISRKEAQDYIEAYFATYPKIKEFLDRTVKRAKADGYVTTMFGRRRPMPELKSPNFMQRSFGERVAMNAPIQGTAADIIKIAMIRVNRRLKEEHLAARLLLQIHDELLIEAPLDEVEAVSAILREEMEHAADLAVELAIDLKTGKSWYEAH